MCCKRLYRFYSIYIVVSSESVLMRPMYFYYYSQFKELKIVVFQPPDAANYPLYISGRFSLVVFTLSRRWGLHYPFIILFTKLMIPNYTISPWLKGRSRLNFTSHIIEYQRVKNYRSFPIVNQLAFSWCLPKLLWRCVDPPYPSLAGPLLESSFLVGSALRPSFRPVRDLSCSLTVFPMLAETTGGWCLIALPQTIRH